VRYQPIGRAEGDDECAPAGAGRRQEVGSLHVDPVTVRRRSYIAAYVADLQLAESCSAVTKGAVHVYNLAADMGGMGFIENNKALCMLSVLINRIC
jgi:hypothetical protein